MKCCVGPVLFAFVASPFVNVSPANAVSCTFNSPTVVVDGQAQSVSISGCHETASATGPIGSTAGGFLNLGAGLVSGTVQTKGNATISLAGQVTFTVQATLPTFSFLNPSTRNVIQIGNINYVVDSVSLQVFGTAVANVVNQDQALGAFIGLGYNGSGFSFFCGSADSVCGGISQPWEAKTPISPNLLISSTINFSQSMAERLQLTSGINLSDNPSIDAFDPFNITSMELLDANGVVIPGVQFVADDGTIFPETGSATPLPAALPMFAGGAGLIEFLARRRKQKRAA